LYDGASASTLACTASRVLGRSSAKAARSFIEGRNPDSEHIDLLTDTPSPPLLVYERSTKHVLDWKIMHLIGPATRSMTKKGRTVEAALWPEARARYARVRRLGPSTAT